jgi:hypothetical protein
MRFALASVRNLSFLTGCTLVFSCLSIQAFAQGDPPDQAGRISSISGNVSIQSAGSDDWGQAYPNLPIGPGDRIFTDEGGRAEIQVGQSYIRVGHSTDITFIGEGADSISFGLAQGAVHVRSFGFWDGQGLDVSTPSGDIEIAQPGEYRVEAMPDENAAIFTNFGSNALVSGAGDYSQQMGNWQTLELQGSNPVYPQWLQPNDPDGLDQWSQQRDSQIANAASYRYVSAEVGGAAELDASGDWIPDSDYGPMWFPRGVAYDWAPYREGHWINRDPWGWIWVEDEPWGYAPFHYGRWVQYHGRWGWIPGPREVHPVWSPALVVFAGGGGVGVSAWFPLGPGEPYRPWYHCSPHYIDQINITNIHESRVVHVQTTYVNVVNVTNVTNITYVNRTVGVSAMRQADFAAGHPVRQASVTVNVNVFQHVQVVDQPAPVMRQSFNPRPVARPVAVMEPHPTFINRQGMQISARPGGPPPQPPPVRQVQAPRPMPGRTAVAPPPGARPPNFGGNPRPTANQPARQMPQNEGRPQSYPNQSQQPSNPRPTENHYNPPHFEQPAERPAQAQPANPRPEERNPNPPQENNRYNPPPNNQPQSHPMQPAERPAPQPPQPNRNAGSPPPEQHRNTQPPPPQQRGNQPEKKNDDKHDKKDEKKPPE